MLYGVVYGFTLMLADFLAFSAYEQVVIPPNRLDQVLLLGRTVICCVAHAVKTLMLPAMSPEPAIKLLDHPRIFSRVYSLGATYALIAVEEVS